MVAPPVARLPSPVDATPARALACERGVRPGALPRPVWAFHCALTATHAPAHDGACPTGFVWEAPPAGPPPCVWFFSWRAVLCWLNGGRHRPTGTVSGFVDGSSTTISVGARRSAVSHHVSAQSGGLWETSVSGHDSISKKSVFFFESRLYSRGPLYAIHCRPVGESHYYRRPTVQCLDRTSATPSQW